MHLYRGIGVEWIGEKGAGERTGGEDVETDEGDEREHCR